MHTTQQSIMNGELVSIDYFMKLPKRILILRNQEGKPCLSIKAFIIVWRLSIIAENPSLHTKWLYLLVNIKPCMDVK